MRVCSLRLIGAAALAFATPASTVSLSDSATIEARANAPTDEDAAQYLDGTFTNVHETPLPSALLLLAAGVVLARYAAGSDRRRTRDRAAAGAQVP
jgi:hypothetical protein